MRLGPGSRLGPYEVTALIGEGGMGKVWRAHHVALNRDDALKVLPDAFATDPDRLARFRREAQVLASLNHPNIAHVYGLEQTDGVQALVMELVDGPTLADRVAQGPIPVDEALPIAKQIAEALEPMSGPATQTVLLRGGHHAQYVRSGHLVYGAAGTLRAVACDLERFTVSGNPVPVVERVVTTPVGAVDAVVGANGTLVYVSGGRSTPRYSAI